MTESMTAIHTFVYRFKSVGIIIAEILCEEEHPVCAFP